MLAVALVVLLAGAVAYAARVTRAEEEAAQPVEPAAQMSAGRLRRPPCSGSRLRR